MKSSESTDSDEKKDTVPEIKSLEEIRREKATAISQRAQAFLAAKRLREMNERSYSPRSGGSKGLLDVDVGSISTNLKRKGKEAKTDVDLEDMETDVAEGCKITKKTRNNDDNMDSDGSGSGAAPEPRVTRSSSRTTVDPV